MSRCGCHSGPSSRSRGVGERQEHPGDGAVRALARELNGSREPVGAHDKLTGAEHVDKIIEIDQSPIGRTPRSNPATYTGLFGPIRELFAGVPESRVRGYSPGRFSFNVKGGRCENCKGDGILKIEMQFLPDVRPLRGLQGEALQPRGARDPLQGQVDRGRAGDDDRGGARVLQRRAERPIQAPDPKRRRPGIRPSRATGDHGPGGEAQRVKLSTELSRRATGRTLYVLDEPTTGLHFADVEKLLEVLHRLVEGGNTVLVIEHNLDVIKTADRIVDLGPEEWGPRRPSSPRARRRRSRRRPDRPPNTDRSCAASRWCSVGRLLCAEEAGRADPHRTNGHVRAPVAVPATPSRKRATAAAKAAR